MSESLFSESWYRVKNLKPELRRHTQIHHHIYRGEDWFVLQDHSSGRYHRFSPEAYQIIGMMDGTLSLDRIWTIACERLGDDMPTQEEVISLLGQLHRADALLTNIPPDITELVDRRVKERRMRFWGQLRSPMSIKVPLFDPERFLRSTYRYLQPLFGWFGLLLWSVVVIWALTLLAPNWSGLSRDVADRVFSMENMILIWFIYPLVKVIHEFGHAYMVKRWGGEVHEMGVMFLVLMPIPYVDASSSLAFKQKSQRMMVGAAGILVELFLAAIALILWAHLEPGAMRAVCYNIILICGVSTLLFNGNPLLRFDAYYVFSDYLEIPNLGNRANHYLGYLVKRYLVGVKEEYSPAQTPGEARWLAGYAIAAFIYRIFISIRIILFVAGKFFVIGVVLAIWAAVNMVVTPIYKNFKTWTTEPRLERYRTRALVLALSFVGTVAIVSILIPLPAFTVTDGVVWVPEQARVFAGTDSFVEQVVVEPGNMVEKGDLLFVCSDPELDSQVELLQAQLVEYRARYRSSLVGERSEVEILRDEIERIEGELRQAEEKRADLVVHSPVSGRFLAQNPDDMPGRFVGRGALMGYVVDKNNVIVRVVVSQEQIDLVRNRTTGIESRLAGQLTEVLPATISRVVPAATRELPALSLSVEGGGKIALDPESSDKPRAYETYFQFDLNLPAASIERVGERVAIRFVHTPEPLVWRWYRSARRLFLRYLAV